MKTTVYQNRQGGKARLLLLAFAFFLFYCAPVFPPPESHSDNREPQFTSGSSPDEIRSPLHDSLVLVLRAQDSLLLLKEEEGEKPNPYITQSLRQLEDRKQRLYLQLDWPSLTKDSTNLPSEKVCPLNTHSEVVNYDSWLNCLSRLKTENRQKEIVSEVQTILKKQLPPKVFIQAFLIYGDALELTGKSGQAKKVFARLSQYAEEFKSISNTADEQVDHLQFQEDSLSPAAKIGLDNINNAFSSGALYPEISSLALKLLEIIDNSKIRRTVKQLVTQSWERDNKSLTKSVDSLTILLDDGVSKEDISPVAQFLETKYAHLGAPSLATLKKRLDIQEVLVSDNPDSVYTLSEELIQKGQHLEAVKNLKTLLNTEFKTQAQEKINLAGTLYCSEKREKASNLFKSFNSSKDKNSQIQYLKQAHELLGDCLNAFPNIPISKKVKENQNLIKNKLKNLNE